MKKLLLTLLLLSVSNLVFSQIYNRGADSKDMKLLAEKGLTYIPTGNPATDQAFISAFKEYWKLGEVKIAAFRENSDTTSIDAGIVAFQHQNQKDQACLVIANSKSLDSEHSLGVGMLGINTVAHIYMNGFTGSSDEKSIVTFAPQLVKALNDGLSIIKEYNITGLAFGPGPDLSKQIYHNAVALKDKQLLILDHLRESINTGALEKKGISYEFISLENYRALDKIELPNYCLMYFSQHSGAYTDFAIFDLENNNLIYTEHINGQLTKFSNDEINHVIRFWK